MDMKPIFESNTTILKTPLTDFSIIDDAGKAIQFDVIPSTNTVHTVYLNNDEKQRTEVKKYAECIIRLHTRNLIIGRTYTVLSTSELEYRDSDEHLFTLGITKDDTMLAVSFPDPNDDTKCFPELYHDEMKWYDFNFDDGKVTFELIDRKKDEIWIPVAWIWNVNDNFVWYESAVEVFVLCYNKVVTGCPKVI